MLVRVAAVATMTMAMKKLRGSWWERHLSEVTAMEMLATVGVLSNMAMLARMMRMVLGCRR